MQYLYIFTITVYAWTGKIAHAASAENKNLSANFFRQVNKLLLNEYAETGTV